ncbi:lipocalin family protein [Terricaulis sp.]|uniref:lipocalin family protein n=1 Tax=Terricaulis sp. TaxID=2768686 RepID=UPI002AC39782|nr:lipocalin family protein [Terricaulis sp.]MDZ4690078.1 lipocalin family protein [Terricaulis sp.]
MRYLIIALAVSLAGCVGNPVYRQSGEPHTVVTIDQARYLGLWHEQARLPNSFERDCVHVTAEYGARDDGRISVINRCVNAEGRSRDAVGQARFVGAPSEGKLEVSFFGPFWGDYWVLERADDYAWSIVGEPQGRFLWVLTRAETITPAQRAHFERRISALGYRPSDLIWRE